jgi:hypothetical protein
MYHIIGKLRQKEAYLQRRHKQVSLRGVPSIEINGEAGKREVDRVRIHERKSLLWCFVATQVYLGGGRAFDRRGTQALTRCPRGENKTYKKFNQMPSYFRMTLSLNQSHLNPNYQ